MRVLVLVLLLACGEKTDGRFKQVATDFAQKLVARDTAGAHAMLDKSLSVELSPAQLEAKFDAMMKPVGGAKGATLVNTMTSWPDKRPSDAGWAYVSIDGVDGGEGLTLVITKQGHVRTIEWGRP